MAVRADAAAALAAPALVPVAPASDGSDLYRLRPEDVVPPPQRLVDTLRRIGPGHRAGRLHRGIGRADRHHDPRRAGRLHRALADRPELPRQAGGPGRDGPLHDRDRRDRSRGLRPRPRAAPGRELARVVVRGHGAHDDGPDRRDLRRRGPGDGHPGARRCRWRPGSWPSWPSPWPSCSAAPTSGWSAWPW